MAGLKWANFQNGTYQVGRVINAVSATFEVRETEPPRRYTQDELMDDMMAAHKFAATDAERAVLKSISGLGTARTREPTITAMMDRGFVEVKKSKRERGRSELVPTGAGRTMVDNLPKMLTSVAMTAKWELAFRLIEQGKATSSDVEKHLAGALDLIVAEAKAVGTIKIPVDARKAPVANQFNKSSGTAGARK